MNSVFRGTFELAATLLGIATLALLINKSSNTVQVVKGLGGTFNELIRTVTLQSGSGINWN